MRDGSDFDDRSQVLEDASESPGSEVASEESEVRPVRRRRNRRPPKWISDFVCV